jgi:hypothetical protein
VVLSPEVRDKVVGTFMDWDDKVAFHEVTDIVMSGKNVPRPACDSRCAREIDGEFVIHIYGRWGIGGETELSRELAE